MRSEVEAIVGRLRNARSLAWLVLADPGHEEHEHLLSWVGGSFDPEAFDLAGRTRTSSSTTGTPGSGG
ncbi:MAG: hypothetical protein QOK15_2201 [Nocardioidaceae bacterium]|nr:hypothetical protein [Nocardioidaceae bacterium]